jgi:hypothetical protein
MKIRVILFLSLCFGFDAVAQCITAPQRRGCVPFSVKVEVIPGSTCDAASQKLFAFSPNSFSIVDTHTYFSAGLYTVYFSANFSTGGLVLDFPGFFEALAPTPPAFSVLLCEGQQVRVRIDSGAYEEYQIDYGDGSPVDIINSPATLGALHTYSNTQQRTITVTGRYVPGNCGASSSRQVVPLGSIPTPSISALKSSQGRNTLEWSTQSGIRYVIYRDGLALDTLTAQAALTSFADVPPDVNLKSYCYQVASIDGCLTLKNSNTVCSFSAFNVVAENDQNTIRWLAPQVGVSSIQLIRVFHLLKFLPTPLYVAVQFIATA